MREENQGDMPEVGWLNIFEDGLTMFNHCQEPILDLITDQLLQLLRSTSNFCMPTVLVKQKHSKFYERCLRCFGSRVILGSVEISIFGFKSGQKLGG